MRWSTCQVYCTIVKYHSSLTRQAHYPLRTGWDHDSGGASCANRSTGKSGCSRGRTEFQRGAATPWYASTTGLPNPLHPPGHACALRGQGLSAQLRPDRTRQGHGPRRPPLHFVDEGMRPDAMLERIAAFNPIVPGGLLAAEPPVRSATALRTRSVYL